MASGVSCRECSRATVSFYHYLFHMIVDVPLPLGTLPSTPSNTTSSSQVSALTEVSTTVHTQATNTGGTALLMPVSYLDCWNMISLSVWSRHQSYIPKQLQRTIRIQYYNHASRILWVRREPFLGLAILCRHRRSSHTPWRDSCCSWPCEGGLFGTYLSRIIAMICWHLGKGQWFLRSAEPQAIALKQVCLPNNWWEPCGNLTRAIWYEGVRLADFYYGGLAFNQKALATTTNVQREWYFLQE